MRFARGLLAVAIAGVWLLCGSLTSESDFPSSYAAETPAVASVRTPSGLLALYDFHASSGSIVVDRSGVGKPVDLRIADTKSVRWSEGSLEVLGNTVIQSDEAATKITDSIRRSGEITIEAWVRPTKTAQNGPARIITLSKNVNERNFTLAQDGDRFDVRLRTTKTSANGLPSLRSPSKSLVAAELTHVVYTRDRTGRTRFYINGRQSAEQTASGATSNWDGLFRLALANELSRDRPWLGTFYLVAIYDRDLLPNEVQQNFQAGPGAAGPSVLAGKQPAPKSKPAASAREAAATKASEKPLPVVQRATEIDTANLNRAQLFETQIAPLLARHCLQCHDSAVNEGGLDLSRKNTSLAGGESGKAIVPGKAVESLLWQYVESDFMPEDRPPLSNQEKAFLRQWIDAGAIWTADVIDPANYAGGRNSGDIWLQRLTVAEYIETVRSAVGVDIEQETRRILPPDLRADGFSNTAYNLNVDLGHVEAYAKLAEIIVARMDVARFAASYTRRQDLTQENLRELIANMGKWLLRGPLEEHEITAYLRISSAVSGNGGDFHEAVSYIVEAMLQSPRFIYRIENQRGVAATRPASGYELASRMSYILWGGPPDKELMRAADGGELANRNHVEAQVRRMLQDPRSVARSSQFIHQWLDLERLDNLRPNPDRFPRWDAKIAADMRDETLAFFKHVAWEQNRPLADLLNAQVTFATPRLAEHYGFERNRSGASPGRPLATIQDRGASGLQALYTFDEAGRNIIRDVSGMGQPLDLQIENSAAVNWNQGQLTMNASTLIAAPAPPKKLVHDVMRSNAFTLEAWITPADTRQSGPARILTLSSGTGQRNFTLGQDGDKYEVRFRTTTTDANGLPGLSSPSGAVQTEPTHIIYTRDASGRAKLYIDGQQVAASDVGGTLSNWDNNFRLALANETTKDRAWRGTIHRIAIYSRALSPDEIRTPDAAGPSRHDLSSVPGRGGLLTQGSVLTVGGDEASMVTRGLFVLRELLRGTVNDPPPCVDTTPVPTGAGLTQRAIAEARIANSNCGGCHAKFEPLAFGLERFDGLGAYHEKDEHGNNLRDDGQILFPGSDKPVSYDSSAQLMDLLASSDRVRECLTWKVAQFALGRPLVAADAPILKKIHESAEDRGGTYASLITAIVMSDLVQMTQTQK